MSGGAGLPASLREQELEDLVLQFIKQRDELQAVLKMVADAFDGGPEHPWIPGFNAKPIYQPVMDAVKAFPKQAEVCSCIRQPQEPQCTDCPEWE